MGEVYRAFDLMLDQTVALKFLSEAASHGEAALARFRNEVRIARQVSHPNVCRVYDIGVIDGCIICRWNMWTARTSDSLCAASAAAPG